MMIRKEQDTITNIYYTAIVFPPEQELEMNDIGILDM
jgi:hypothetical protein